MIICSCEQRAVEIIFADRPRAGIKYVRILLLVLLCGDIGARGGDLSRVEFKIIRKRVEDFGTAQTLEVP